MPTQPRSAHSPSTTLEVDIGVALPTAYGGLRKVVAALRDHAPGIFEEHLRRRPSEWNCLIPGVIAAAPDLADLALSPSERRLHKESEQVLRVLTAGAALVVEVLRETRCTLHLRNAGEADVVSLRGFMRAMEWARLEGLEGSLRVSGFGSRRRYGSSWFEPRRREYIDALRRRMRLPLDERPDGAEARREKESPVDPEGRYLSVVVDEQAAPELRIAAALLTSRACFFSTNEEGTLLAGETGLGLLDAFGSRLSIGGIHRAWDELDQGSSNPAVELERSDLEDLETVRGTLLRRAGSAHAFTGEYDLALRRFAQAARLKLAPVRRAELMNYHAICAIKRADMVDAGVAELHEAMKLIQGQTTPQARLQEAWLRNGLALVYWSRRQLPEAFEEVRLAAAVAGDLHDPPATHAKINLLSNISVLQETDHRYEAAVETWRKFERISRGWGANFDKHYRYRLGGLTLKLGQPEESLRQYAQAFENTRELGDDFYGHRIALEQGTHQLKAGNKDVAAGWYDKALEAARSMGDPLAIAHALAGKALACGGTFDDAATAARASTTHERKATSLLEAISGGDTAELLGQLPTPRAKLNVPYESVNL